MNENKRVHLFLVILLESFDDNLGWGHRGGGFIAVCSKPHQTARLAAVCNGCSKAEAGTDRLGEGIGEGGSVGGWVGGVGVGGGLMGGVRARH
jgi:hypothetical protein